MERDNRKSHLAPQLSPSTQDVLRSRESPDAAQEDRALETPTSGEIPIVGAIMSPRDQYSSVSNRSPTRSERGAGPNAGRPGGPTVHPGIGKRGTTTNSIPKTKPPPPASYSRHSPNPSAGSINGKQQTTFALPMRPPSTSGPPPPPPRRQAPQRPDNVGSSGSGSGSGSSSGSSRGLRRQATIGPLPGTKSGYGMGYPNQVRRE